MTPVVWILNFSKGPNKFVFVGGKPFKSGVMYHCSLLGPFEGYEKMKCYEYDSFGPSFNFDKNFNWLNGRT
jgi:hypothetical protein